MSLVQNFTNDEGIHAICAHLNLQNKNETGMIK